MGWLIKRHALGERSIPSITARTSTTLIPRGELAETVTVCVPPGVYDEKVGWVIWHWDATDGVANVTPICGVDRLV